MEKRNKFVLIILLCVSVFVGIILYYLYSQHSEKTNYISTTETISAFTEYKILSTPKIRRVIRAYKNSKNEIILLVEEDPSNQTEFYPDENLNELPESTDLESELSSAQNDSLQINTFSIFRIRSFAEDIETNSTTKVEDISLEKIYSSEYGLLLGENSKEDEIVYAEWRNYEIENIDQIATDISVFKENDLLYNIESSETLIPSYLDEEKIIYSSGIPGREDEYWISYKEDKEIERIVAFPENLSENQNSSIFEEVEEVVRIDIDDAEFYYKEIAELNQNISIILTLDGYLVLIRS